MSKDESRWTDYYKVHKDRKPSKLLVKSLGFVKNKESALELGAGTPVDAIFLSENGFKVTAVDKEPESENFFKEVSNVNINFILSDFNDFSFSKETYDIVSAQRSLPFIEKKEDLFDTVNKIKGSLKNDGVFSGQLFGINDEWNIQGKKMSFVDKNEVQKLFSDMKIVYLSECEEDSRTANGNPKHWHIFDIIAIKN